MRTDLGGLATGEPGEIEFTTLDVAAQAEEVLPFCRSFLWYDGASDIVGGNVGVDGGPPEFNSNGITDSGAGSMDRSNSLARAL